VDFENAYEAGTGRRTLCILTEYAFGHHCSKYIHKAHHNRGSGSIQADGFWDFLFEQVLMVYHFLSGKQ